MSGKHKDGCMILIFNIFNGDSPIFLSFLIKQEMLRFATTFCSDALRCFIYFIVITCTFKWVIIFHSNFRKYPAYLSVTVESYRPKSTRSVSLTRPMSVLEEEITGDIYTCASDGDEPSEQISQKANANDQHSMHNSVHQTRILKLESRLPGQVWKFLQIKYLKRETNLIFVFF